MNLEEAIRTNNLNENEVRIYQEIMRCIEARDYKATIRDVAKVAYVSTASVVRLAQKLGYLGYKDMVISLKNEEIDMLDCKLVDVLSSILINRESEEKLDELISDIMSGEYHRIHSIGIGYSRLPGEYLQQKLEELDFVATQKSPLDFAVQKPFLMVFFSENGETYDLQFIAERCRNMECKLYVICSRPESTICQIVPNRIIVRRNEKDSSNKFLPNFFIGNTMMVLEGMVAIISNLCRERS